jgi:hypothetical protein
VRYPGRYHWPRAYGWHSVRGRPLLGARRLTPVKSLLPSESVPDLTRIRDIKLNNRVSLRSKANSVAFEHRTIAVRVGATDLNHEHVKQWLTQCGLSGYEIKDGPSTCGWTFIAPSRTASRSARQASKSRRHFRSAASRFRKLLADP